MDKNKRIYLSSPHMSEEGYELEYVNEAFDTNWIAPLGPNVNGFEDEFAHLLGVQSAAALSSGTAAIHLALKNCGVKEGDVVICPSLTFAATVNPVMYEKAIPVFVDSDEKTWNMSPKLLIEALNKYPNAKAVLLVHLYGLSAELESIVKICKNYNIPLIEDAAESLGTYYKGQQTGTFGEYGIFSFNGNKIITTSGGGMLVSNNNTGIDKARFWATQARDQARHYEHSELGYNYRMSNVVAGIGRGQLNVLNDRVNKKNYIYNYYKKALSSIEEICFMPDNKFDQPNYWLSCITLGGTVNPIDIIEALEKENIESRPIWKPMHLQPFYSGYDYFGQGVSEKLFEHGLCLPSDTKMTDDDIEKICNIIKGLYV